MYLIISVFSLSAPGSVIRIASGQIIIAGAKVLDGGDDGQCPSVEEGERARNEIDQAVGSVTVGEYSCNGTPGWRHIAFINMTDTSYDCPSGLNLTSYSKRTCGPSHIGEECSSTTFSVGGPYSLVCGRMRGYQVGAPIAFFSSTRGINIDSYYVEGISLTYGAAGSQQHIWTFAAGAGEMTTIFDDSYACPCNTASPSIVPAFVGNDYFCESGLHYQ